MVTERADMPEHGDIPAVETQGITDLTPQGQDSPNFGVVDDAPVEQTATPVADDSGTQVPVEGQAPPVPTEQIKPSIFPFVSLHISGPVVS